LLHTSSRTPAPYARALSFVKTEDIGASLRYKGVGSICLTPRARFC
jgi:hypothetical protein